MSPLSSFSSPVESAVSEAAAAAGGTSAARAALRRRAAARANGDFERNERRMTWGELCSTGSHYPTGAYLPGETDEIPCLGIDNPWGGSFRGGFGCPPPNAGDSDVRISGPPDPAQAAAPLHHPMQLHSLDIGIIVGYFILVISVGLWVSRKGSKDLDSYFLGGKTMPWYMLGVSDASGMFDISGTMWLVYVLFIYGLKSIWLPWVWPTFNQIFLMMFMSAWLRRSNVLTGAQWMQTRFGNDKGATYAHLSVVGFALMNVIGMLAYAFKGIGKFASGILPWHFTRATTGVFTDENIYAMILLGLTSIYAIKGGMVSVVITEVAQFTILTLSALCIGVIALVKVSPAMIANNIPAGWLSPFFGWKIGLNWDGILNTANQAIHADGNDFFTIIFGLMFFKGVLASLAGPAPNYDMQRILATRNPREASLMNGMVNVVLMFPRYLMIAGITVLALAFCMPIFRAQGNPDFEKILPLVLTGQVPTGVLGLLLAGLAAAFMSNFAATLNSAPAYVVNDIYKRFINPQAGNKQLVGLSRTFSIIFLVVGVGCGLMTTSITSVMMWLVGALSSGYVAANVLKCTGGA